MYVQQLQTIYDVQMHHDARCMLFNRVNALRAEMRPWAADLSNRARRIDARLCMIPFEFDSISDISILVIFLLELNLS